MIRFKLLALTHPLAIVLLLSPSNLWAAPQLELSSEPQVFFWLILTTLGFALGALNGLLILLLRTWRYQYAGSGWAVNFWLGMLMAPGTILLVKSFMKPLPDELSLSHLALPLVIIMILNISGVWWLAWWAAKE